VTLFAAILIGILVVFALIMFLIVWRGTPPL
jgi:hypothetical protein